MLLTAEKPCLRPRSRRTSWLPRRSRGPGPSPDAARHRVRVADLVAIRLHLVPREAAVCRAAPSRPLPLSAWATVIRDGMLVMVADERMPLMPGEEPVMRSIRFRTLGCYPLTGAIESEAATLTEVIQEMLLTTTSERQGRLIDVDSAGSMEKKKQEGYF